jgi:hypothetical protein
MDMPIATGVDYCSTPLRHTAPTHDHRSIVVNAYLGGDELRYYPCGVDTGGCS